MHFELQSPRVERRQDNIPRAGGVDAGPTTNDLTYKRDVFVSIFLLQTQHFFANFCRLFHFQNKSSSELNGGRRPRGEIYKDNVGKAGGVDKGPSEWEKNICAS